MARRLRKRPLTDHQAPLGATSVALEAGKRHGAAGAGPSRRETNCRGAGGFFEGLISPHARYTQLQRTLLTSITACLAGRPGARLAAALSIRVAKDELLELLCGLPELPQVNVRVLGVDDLALRKGDSYATILVDLEGRRPVDVRRHGQQRTGGPVQQRGDHPCSIPATVDDSVRRLPPAAMTLRAPQAGSPCRPVLRRPRHDPEGGSRERPCRLSDGPQDAPWREDMMDDAAYDLWPRVILNTVMFALLAISFFHPSTKRDWRAMGAQ
jgi:hypothetical protein